MKPAILITGGQTGIGFGIAKKLADAGFVIAMAANSKKDSDEVQIALSKLGKSAYYYQHNLRDIDKIPTLLANIEADIGPISCLISNAGVASPIRGDMLDLRPENYDNVMDINLKGAYFLAQNIAKRLLAQKTDIYQSIIFITSVSADMVSIERPEYCISKAGASMMSQLFAARLAAENIGVFELRPGIIATDMTAAVHDKYSDHINNGLVPAKRWGHPVDIASVVLPLVKGQMAFANGAIIPVDGGLSIHRL